MVRSQFILPLHQKLIIDNFAGGGGASTGIELALGRCVDHAINHDAKALGMHRINHPQTVHHHEDVFDIDPIKITQGIPVGLCHNSPDCKHFSKAKGGKPVDKRIRGLCLVMLRWAKIRSEVLTMENVEEIVTWGPLKRIRKGETMEWHPDPEHKGRTWRAFLSILSTGIDADHPDLPEILDVLAGTITLEECVQGFGYQYEARVIRACEHNTPTIRKRLYMIARCDGNPIIWPSATHGSPKEQRLQVLAAGPRLKPWRTIAECLDWHLPCPSIFLEGMEARAARCKRPLAKSTLRRIAAGIDRYVLKAERPFLVSLTHQGGDRVESVDEPARTLTGAHRGEKALVAPTVVNSANGKTTGRGPNTWTVEEPMRTATAGPSFNQVQAELAPFLTEHANASAQRTFPADEPLRTQCGEVKGGHFAMVGASMVQTGYGEREGQAPRVMNPEQPGGTAVAGGVKQALATATLFGAGGRAAQSRPRGMEEPIHTVTSKGDTCLASAMLIGAGGPVYSGKPKPVDAPMNAQTTENHAALASASLVKLRGDCESHPLAGELAEPGHTISAGGLHHGLVAVNLTRQFGNSIGQEVDAAGPTVMAGGGGKTGLVSTYLAQHNGGFNEQPGHPADEPISTLSSKGSQQQVVAASMAAYYGSERDGQAVDEPARTPTTKPRLGFVESSCAQAMTAGQIAGAHRVAAFLRAHGVVFEGEFATVRGYVIVDIGMRMLTARELFRAQGFPEDYVIDKAWLVCPQTLAIREVKLTKEEQIRMCGNSVCPPVMEALVRCNVPDLCAWEKGERPRSHQKQRHLTGTSAPRTQLA